MMKKRRIKILLIIIGILFLLIGIPLIINESYKVNSGYQTVWNASNVLSYYGTIVSGIITVLVLAITIKNNTNQILSERLYQSEVERWRKTEIVIDEVIESLNPLLLINTLQNEINNIRLNAPDIMEIVTRIHSKLDNQLLAKDASFNRLNIIVGIKEHQELTTLCQNLNNMGEQYKNSVQNLEKKYFLLRIKRITKKIMNCFSDCLK